MWLITLITVIIAAFCYFKLRKLNNYWNEKGVACEQPVFIFGNMISSVFRSKSLLEIVVNMYKKYSKHRYGGFYQFTDPILVIRDLELIKQITVKDFDVFPDHRPALPTDTDPLWEKNILQMTAKNGWHSMRSMLSPSFTGSKMKTLFTLMQACSKQFIEYFKSHNTTIPFNVKDSFSKYANDVIGTSAFGITCNSLQNPNNEFYLMGKEATDFSGLRIFLLFLGYNITPTLMKLFKVTLFTKRVSFFFRKTIKETLDYRRNKNIVRPDMIHLMMEAQKLQSTIEGDNKSKQLTELTDESMTAQALIFFFAGFETVSSAMSFLAYDLAVHPDIQQKLYKEINESLNDGQTATYEILTSMKYLDCVISESLRLHPSLPFLDRKSVKPYTIDPVLPWEKPLHLKEGSVVWIPTSGIHRDEQYFPNPNKFDPERFNSENKHKILPFTYLPFGSGPRNCIGSRFALLEIKLILVELLQTFELVTNEKTQIPLKLSKTNFNNIPDEGIWLSLKPRVLN